MIENIVRMIEIIEIYKKLSRNAAGALKEVFKTFLHEKLTKFWKKSKKKQDLVKNDHFVNIFMI